MMGTLASKRELRAKLATAMLLLGHGTIADIRALGIACDPPDLISVTTTMPQLGIVYRISGFSGPLSEQSLGDLARPALKRWPGLIERIAAALCDRGEYGRAGRILAEIAGEADVARLAFRHAFDLMNAGHWELVESLVFDQAYEPPAFLGPLVSATEGLLWASPRDVAREYEGARAAVSDARAGEPSEGESPEMRQLLIDQAEALVELMGSWLGIGGRAGDEGGAPAGDEPRPATVDPLCQCLHRLVDIREALIGGGLLKASKLLEGCKGLVEDETIAGTMLLECESACSRLMGAVPEAAQLRRLDDLIEAIHGDGLDLLAQSLEGSICAVRGFLGDEGISQRLRRLSERLARHPDPYLRGAVAVACASELYREHSFYAALTLVRGLSLELASTGSADLVCSAYTLEALCQGALGEEPQPLPATVWDFPAGLGIRPLARCAYVVAVDVFRVVEEIDPQTLGTLFDAEPPTYAALALTALALKGSWPQALALKRLLPVFWREAALALAGEDDGEGQQAPGESPTAIADGEGAPEADARGMDGRGSASGHEGAAGREGAAAPGDGGRITDASRLLESPPLAKPLAERDGAHGRQPAARRRVSPIDAPKLEVRMLGAFEVRLGGRPIPDASWRRKASKLVLAALAIAPSHSLTRASICEALWPDGDYARSRNSLYSVLSSLRDTLGCVDQRPPYIVCEQGRVRLNPKLVECDVDIFESRCHEVLCHTGDRAWRLSLCRHLGRLYGNGLFIPIQDVRGEYQAKRQALETLYVDLLVEASELSLKCGLAKEAIWFAGDACLRGSLREDAVSCRLRAFAAEGRVRELDGAYRDYCTSLSEGFGMAPSHRVRELYRKLKRLMRDELPKGPDASRQEPGGFKAIA